MYNVLVQIAKVDTALPVGAAFARTNLVVTDAAGAVLDFALNGSESPPWSQLVKGLADGESSYSAQDVDFSGALIGAAVTAKYTPVAVTFPASSGISFTAA